MLKVYIKNLFISVARISVFLFCFTAAYSQQANPDSLLQEATLQNVIRYTLKRQPVIEQSLIDEKITNLEIKSRLADWYPQINFNYLYQHNFQVQQTVIGGNVVRLGVNNTSAVQFSGSQIIFDRDVLLAKRSKKDVILQSQQQTINSKIDAVVNVTKAFYAVLATQQQIGVTNQTITRLQKSLNDARAQYDAGLVDKTDYKRATIALNNAIATKKTTEEDLKARTAFLKFLMNYPVSGPLTLLYDSKALDEAIALDTLETINYSKRIEYQILKTRKSLLETNLQYNKWSYLPSLSANGAYNLNFQNDEFSKLYSQQFPNSYAGLTLRFPIFQGGKRKYEVKQAELEITRTDLELINLENSINSEYNDALSAYKSNLVYFFTTKENIAGAQEVYDVIELQYRSGIKAYIEVIAAETELRTAQLNYYNALYLLLSSKIDVQRALGNIEVINP